MDADLVIRAQRGDKDAYAVLAAGIADRLLAVARRILRDYDLAEDATQQALLAAWRDLPQLRDPDRFESWSYRLLVRACYAESRRERRWAPSLRLLPVGDQSADGDLSSVVDRDEIERGFRRLSIEHRAVVVLHHYLDLPLDRVAELLGIPVGTAHSRLHHAMRGLRAAIDADARPPTREAAEMSTDRDTARIVRSWLRTDEHESADRVLDNVLALLDATPQRRSWWPARRIADMNTLAKVAAAVAAVVVAAVAVVNLTPGTGGPGGTPTPSPTPAPSASPSSSPTPAPSAAIDFPPDGALAAGRHSMTRGDVLLSINVPTPGWRSAQGYFIEKDTGVGPDGASLLFWDPDAVGVYADPCTQRKGPVVGPTTGDLAAAMMTIPDTTPVGPPTDVTVGGRPAKHVVLTISEDVACGGAGEEFYLWYAGDAEGVGRYATVLGATLSVWIVDVDGTRLSIDAETYKGASRNLGLEIQAMIDSIQFE